MKAVLLERYGPPEALAVREVPLPPIRPDEVRVHVRAASVNPADRHNLRPPFFLRRGRGLLRPKDGRIGLDFSGTVAEVGAAVVGVAVGEEVYGVARGAFAEFAVADPSEFADRPRNLSHAQCAAVPIAAVTALQALRDHGKVRAGSRVLINGASGGVGTFAVQLARALGARVSGVCSPANVARNRADGLERVYDYTLEDFTASGERYEVIFDTQLNHPLRHYRRALAPGGRLVMVGAGAGSAGRILLRVLKVALLARLARVRAKFFIAAVRRSDLGYLTGLFEAGTIAPVVDRTFPLEDVRAAFRYLLEGHARGKIVLSLGAPER